MLSVTRITCVLLATLNQLFTCRTLSTPVMLPLALERGML